jgi:cellulose synthase/poly-beta-1,6-N-acetylglucosamine synthase-like glycosyltransferase
MLESVKKIVFVIEWCVFLSLYILSYFFPNKWNISFYGTTLLVFFITQTVASTLNHRYTKNLKNVHESSHSRETSSSCGFVSIPLDRHNKNVCLVVVGHRENPLYWQKCLNSVKNLDPINLRKIYILIDGSEMDDEPMYALAKTTLENHCIPVVIFFCDQRGKRGMLFKGIETVRMEYEHDEKDVIVAMTDSDTELRRDSLIELEKCIMDNPKNGCATGILGIFNQHDGILPKIIHARYLYAFAIERAALSYFGCMTCCSGPLSAYRLSAVSRTIMKRFETQTCGGVQCEPGDDRHLTNLILEQGLYARQTNLAIADTEAPETMLRYLLQQLRWSRSFYRESYWQFKAISKQSFFLGIVTAYESLFPFFITCWVFILLFGQHALYTYISAIQVTFLVLFIRVIIMVCRFRDCRLFYLFLYFPLYFLFLLPTKIFANVTITNNTWVTQSRDTQRRQCSGDAYLFFSFIVIWQISIALGIAHTIYYLLTLS